MKKLILLLLITSTPLFSNFGSFGFTNSKSILMGNAGSVNSDGIYNLGMNPAAIISPTDSSYFQFLFPGLDFGAQAYTNALPIEDVNYYLGGQNGVGRYLTDADKQNLIANFADQGQVGASVNLNILSVGLYVNETIGAFGLNISDHINFNTKVPQSLVELALTGNVPDNTYSFNDFTFSASYLRSYGLTYARRIISGNEGIFKNLNLGATIKMYQGMGYSQLNMLSSSFYTSPDDHALTMAYRAQLITSHSVDLDGAFDDNDDTEPSLSPFPTPSGSGFGFDFGLSAEMDFGAVIGLSLTDIGSFEWTENAQEKIFSAEINIDDLANEDQLDSLEDADEEEFNTLSSIEGELPSALRFGVWVPIHRMASMPGELNVSFDYIQGFNEFAANSTSSRIALGIDYLPVKYAPRILTGFSNDVTGSFRWSFGLGYNLSFFDIYFGTHDLINTFTPNEYASASFGIRWKLY